MWSFRTSRGSPLPSRCGATSKWKLRNSIMTTGFKLQHTLLTMALALGYPMQTAVAASAGRSVRSSGNLEKSGFDMWCCLYFRMYFYCEMGRQNYLKSNKNIRFPCKIKKQSVFLTFLNLSFKKNTHPCCCPSPRPSKKYASNCSSASRSMGIS